MNCRPKTSKYQQSRMSKRTNLCLIQGKTREAAMLYLYHTKVLLTDLPKNPVHWQSIFVCYKERTADTVWPISFCKEELYGHPKGYRPRNRTVNLNRLPRNQRPQLLQSQYGYQEKNMEGRPCAGIRSKQLRPAAQAGQHRQIPPLSGKQNSGLPDNPALCLQRPLFQ